MRRRRVLLLLGLLLALALAVVASVALGARAVPPASVWAAITGGGDSTDALVVRELRVPRTALGLLVGAALGAAGALLQGHTRNPLADPGLLGVSAGAAFAVVLAISLDLAGSPLGYVWFAFAGAFVASAAVFVLGSVGRAGPTPVTLALAGAALSAFLAALTSAVVLLDVETLDEFRFWAVGSIAGRDVAVLTQLAPFLVAGVVLATVHARALDTLALGDDVAASLGQDVRRTRLVGVLVVTVLTGAAVAAAGPIGFLGLVVPHVARLLTGPVHRWLVPVSAVLGATLLLVADVIGRLVLRPAELQVGVVLALIGAPVFIALVRRVRLPAV
jgi:iron complex transport system permease protein